MLLSVQSPLPDAPFAARALPPGPGALPIASTFATVFKELSALGVQDAGLETPAEGPLEAQGESEVVEPLLEPTAPEGDMAAKPLLSDAPEATFPKIAGDDAQIADTPEARETELPLAPPKEREWVAPVAMEKSAQAPAARDPAVEKALAPPRPDLPGAQPTAPERTAGPAQALASPLADSPNTQPEAPGDLPVQPQPESKKLPPAPALPPDSAAPKESAAATPAKADLHIPATPAPIIPPAVRTAAPITIPAPEAARGFPTPHPLQDQWALNTQPPFGTALAPPKPTLPEAVKPAAVSIPGLAAPENTPAPTRMETTAPPSAPEPPARQILQAIQALPPQPSGGSGRIEVVLSPAELGRVEITLTPKDTTTVISFTAERPETADLLRRNIDMLLEDLRKLGFGEAQFGFAGNRGQNAPRAQQFHTGSQTLSHITPAPAYALGNGRLDLRM